jgi:tRNA G10  N-methylase Trm11
VSQAAFAMPGTVQSVVRCQENGPLLAAAAQLWIAPDDLVMDVTYGRGRFWTRYRPRHLVTHDITIDGVDFRHLPEGSSSVDVIVFDPPYIAQGGRETSTIPDMLDRYGLVDVPKTVPEVNQLIADGIQEATRVLRPKGRLLVKCMDYVCSGRLVLGRHHVVTTALGIGLEQVDEFVHYSGTGPQSTWERQLHSRRAHSFLCVFRKSKR